MPFYFEYLNFRVESSLYDVILKLQQFAFSLCSNERFHSHWPYGIIQFKDCHMSGIIVLYNITMRQNTVLRVTHMRYHAFCQYTVSYVFPNDVPTVLYVFSKINCTV